MFFLDANCSQVHDVDDVLGRLADDDVSLVAAISLLGVASVVMLLVGSRIARVASVVVAGLAASLGTFGLLTFVVSPPALDCVPRLLLSCCIGVFAALVTFCVFKTGVSILGGAALGAAAHFIYEAAIAPKESDLLPDAPFTFKGASAWHMALVGASTVLGTVVACAQRRRFLRVSCSLLGGAGVATAVHLILIRHDVAHKRILRMSYDAFLLIIGAISAILGFGIQERIAMRSRNQGR